MKLTIVKRHRVSTLFTEHSLTDQSYKNSTNINYIMEQFAKTGMLPQRQDMVGVYQDNTTLPSLETSLEAQKHANSLFLDLPLDVRTRLHHNPENLLNFVSDPENKDYCLKMGLITPKQAEYGTKELIKEIQNLTDNIKTNNQKIGEKDDRITKINANPTS